MLFKLFPALSYTQGQMATTYAYTPSHIWGNLVIDYFI